jgi:hypothetical protein
MFIDDNIESHLERKKSPGPTRERQRRLEICILADTANNFCLIQGDGGLTRYGPWTIFSKRLRPLHLHSVLYSISQLLFVIITIWCGGGGGGLRLSPVLPEYLAECGHSLHLSRLLRVVGLGLHLLLPYQILVETGKAGVNGFIVKLVATLDACDFRDLNQEPGFIHKENRGRKSRKYQLQI